MLSYVQNQDDYFLFCHRESMMRVLQTVYCKNTKCCTLIFRRNSVYLHCRWLWTTKKKRQVSGKTCCHLNGQIMYVKRCVFHYMRTCGFLKWIYMCVCVCVCPWHALSYHLPNRHLLHFHSSNLQSCGEMKCMTIYYLICCLQLKMLFRKWILELTYAALLCYSL